MIPFGASVNAARSLLFTFKQSVSPFVNTTSRFPFPLVFSFCLHLVLMARIYIRLSNDLILCGTNMCYFGGGCCLLVFLLNPCLFLTMTKDHGRGSWYSNTCLQWYLFSLNQNRSKGLSTVISPPVLCLSIIYRLELKRWVWRTCGRCTFLRYDSL